MAIISNYFNGRTDYPDQYMKIERVDTNKNEMLVEVGIYLTQQLAIDNMPPHAIEHIRGAFDMYSDKNVWEQGYAIMKEKWKNYTDA